MLRLLRNKKAQNTMEYAILIAVVIGAFSVMQIYLKRGLSARVKAGSDNLPDVVLNDVGGLAPGIFGNETQYEPYYIRQGAYEMSTTSSEGTERGIVTEAGGKKELVNATSTRTGTQTITGSAND